LAHIPFSILKRIVMGETVDAGLFAGSADAPFSILKRIVMGETSTGEHFNGIEGVFQYPQADRDG